MTEKTLQQYKHVFFDMDGTLTRSRSTIDNEISNFLNELASKVDVAIISGATKEQILTQIPMFNYEHLSNHVYLMGQSGNDVQYGHEKLWQNNLGMSDLYSVASHLMDLLQKEYRHTKLVKDRLEVRGGQISYSFTGHNSDKDRKARFDPTGEKRIKFLEKTPLKNDDLIVRVGGTTCLDYTRKGWGKRGNIARLIEERGWNSTECVYIGDQFHEGGNDYDVLGLIPCIPVENPEKTLGVIRNMLI